MISPPHSQPTRKKESINMPDTVKITKLTQADTKRLAEINALLPQLAANTRALTLSELIAIIDSPANIIYAAVGPDDSIIGILLVVTVHQLTRVKCWIEDVVVSEAYRGQGVARRLLEAAIAEMPKEAQFISLTSNPRREAARHLYTSLGFEPRDTVVFRRTLTQEK